LHEEHVWQVPEDTVRDLHCVVTGTVVHYDDFDLIGVHLFKHRSQPFESGREAQGLVVGRYD
jgi:hypothetical protein